jgi:antitoxin component of MazEF toxin-antitoxin module
MKIRAMIEGTGQAAAGMHIPESVVEALGSTKRPAVRVTINGYTYRSSIAPMGGGYMLGVSKEVRQLAGVAAGQEVDVEIELDTAPREVVVPDDLAAVLADDADAKRFFESLSYSNQRWYVLQIEGAKTAETRQRRVDKALAMLREGRKP